MLTAILYAAITIAAANRMFGAEPQAKLTPDQISSINSEAKDSEIASLKQQLAQLRQRLIVVEACAEAGIKPSECDVQPDGTLKRKEPSKEKAKQ